MTDPEFVIGRAKQNIKNLNIFRTHANTVMRDAQEKLDKLAQTVRTNMNQGTNMEGFLLGKTKEYVLTLDREDFDLRMDLDEELW